MIKNIESVLLDVCLMKFRPHIGYLVVYFLDSDWIQFIPNWAFSQPNHILRLIRHITTNTTNFTTVHINRSVKRLSSKLKYIINSNK